MQTIDGSGQTVRFGHAEPFGPEHDGTAAVDRIFAVNRQPSLYDYRLSDVLPLQMEAFQQRLDERRAQIAVLDQRAADLGISAVAGLQSVAPLLFAHMTYKSYPESFVSNGRWDRLLAWLDTVSTRRMTDVDVDGVTDIDEFIARLHAAGHYVMATSGTSGKCSLMPQSPMDLARSWEAGARVFSWAWGIPADSSRPVFVFGPGGGPRRQVVIANGIAEAFGRADARYWLTPTPLRVPQVNAAGRLRRRLADGSATPSEIQASDERTRDTQAAMTENVERLTVQVRAHLDEPVVFWGSTVAFYAFVKAARALGLEDGCLHPETRVNLGGGTKLSQLPADFAEDMARFQGDLKGSRSCYGMSEMLVQFGECPAGAWHAAASSILLVLDDAGERVLNPPAGEVAGRLGVFDLAQDGRWGGIVTSDRVRVNFSPCPCGLPSPTVLSCERYDALGAKDDKLTCAGTMDAYIRGVVAD